MDAIAAICAARNDPVQERDPAPVLADLDAVIAHRRQPVRQRRELVEVGGEERLAAEPGSIMDVLDHSLSDADAVVGAGAATDLIDDQQAPVGGVIQDIGGLDHLHHEGRDAAGDGAVGADAGDERVPLAQISMKTSRSRAKIACSPLRTTLSFSLSSGVMYRSAPARVCLR